MMEVDSGVPYPHVSWLPHELALRIFRLVHWTDLLSAKGVSKLWHNLASEPALWTHWQLSLVPGAGPSLPYLRLESLEHALSLSAAYPLTIELSNVLPAYCPLVQDLLSGEMYRMQTLRVHFLVFQGTATTDSAALENVGEFFECLCYGAPQLRVLELRATGLYTQLELPFDVFGSEPGVLRELSLGDDLRISIAEPTPALTGLTRASGSFDQMQLDVLARDAPHLEELQLHAVPYTQAFIPLTSLRAFTQLHTVEFTTNSNFSALVADFAAIRHVRFLCPIQDEDVLRLRDTLHGLPIEIRILGQQVTLVDSRGYTRSCLLNADARGKAGLVIASLTRGVERVALASAEWLALGFASLPSVLEITVYVDESFHFLAPQDERPSLPALRLVRFASPFPASQAIIVRAGALQAFLQYLHAPALDTILLHTSIELYEGLGSVETWPLHSSGRRLAYDSAQARDGLA
ncbi:hypothetical protein EXIGLDRAFT_771089 [Exidia glandulosa HHB12029]|uniref:F-box domain-containing protein n=1 Tax=Exidia glandulosa HHB12029 TaxID=1314781 RepID=A0A165G8X9_EXIGL|nr:hypothetical protein EXIGLDRAFT_771089 [Exidia glandulosa HHB12029]